MNNQIRHIKRNEPLYEYSSEQLQVILSNLHGSKNNCLTSNKWSFEGLKGFTLDTVNIKTLSQQYPHLTKTLGICPIILVKTLFIYSNRGLNDLSSYKNSYDAICKTLYYLAEKNITHLKMKDLDDYFSYQLTRCFHKNNIQTRLTPYTYKVFNNGMDINTWINTFERMGLKGIIFQQRPSKSIIKNALKNCIKSLCSDELTYSDWKEGGSFDYLTLDYGRYYIEHCASFYNEHHPLAAALRHTLSEATEIVKESSLCVNRKGLKGTMLPIIGNFLLGKDIEELPGNYKIKLNKILLGKIKEITLSTYKNYYISEKSKQLLLSDNSILKIIRSLKKTKDHTNYIVLFKIYIEHLLIEIENKRYKALSSYTTINIELLFLDSISLSPNELLQFKQIIEKEYNLLKEKIDPTPPNSSFYKNIGILLSNSMSSTYILEFLRLIEDAGIISFVSLTGWRASEYGFTLKDIKITRNFDLLDQKTSPLRYKVLWFVPKTNGDIKLKREITYNAYNYLTKQSKIIKLLNKGPCLYSYNISMHNPSKSSRQVTQAVGGMWENYTKHYKPFTQLDSLDQLELLQKKAITTSYSSSIYKNLQDLTERSISEKWGRLKDDPNLNAARQKCREELSRVKFFLNNDSRKELVWSYHTKTLSLQATSILNTYLSSDTKSSIKKLTSKEQITPSYTRSIVNEIMMNCLYPTPHSFRHIWAESIYRRFDGDAGWMIRSAFKHVSQNMWLAYIRNKENRRLNDRVKRNVISSLLQNYINKTGRGYAGAIDKTLRRLFLRTTVTNIKDLHSLIDKFATDEIIDIKSNPWGYCLLRKRNIDNAKCAEEGVPQRHNASPALCLGCINNLTSEGNIEGIYLSICNDLNILRTKNIPLTFKRASTKTVKNALLNLRTLNAGVNILNEIEESLNIGKNT